MKKILLTGATGYIGKFVLDFLISKDYEVHALVSSKIPDISAKNLFCHTVDLLDKNKTAELIGDIKPSDLLHLAWYVKHGRFWNAAENLDWVGATLNLAKAFAENGGQRMVFAGTCYEYDHTTNEPLSEKSSRLYPNTLYGTAKLSTNLTLEKYCRINNISYACGRPFFIFGGDENENRLIASVILSLLRNQPAKTSHGNQIRDFIFIEDLAEGFVALLESDVTGSVNIASGKGVKLKEIIETIAEIIGKPELLRIGEIPSSETEPPVIIADVSRLKNEVGFDKAYDLREKLSETINWWKKNEDRN